MPHPKVKISDDSGNTVGITSNRLDVNVAGATMSTGDIEVNSEFPAAATIADNFANPSTTSVMSMLMGYDGAAWDRLLIGGGTEAAALRVTLANDSTGVISVDDGGSTISIDDGGSTISIDDGGNVITVDGTVDLGSTATNHLSEIEGAIEVIETAVTVIGLSTYVDGSTNGIPAAAVRNNVLEDLTGADNTLAPLQVNTIGGLYITGSEVENAAVQSEPLLMGGRYDASARTLGSGDAGAIALNSSGHVIVAGIDDVIYADDADFNLDSSKGIAIMGYNGNQSIDSGDVGVTSLTGTGHIKAVTNLGNPDTFAMIDVDNTSERLSDTIGVVTDCIEIFLQADESNSGYVIVGDVDVADNRGMKLNAGDTLILNVEDTRTLYLWGSAADQNVRCMVTTY